MEMPHVNWKDYKLSPYLFNPYAEYILRVGGLEKNQHGFKTGVRNISNPLYADDSTLTAEHANNLRILLMKVKEHSGKK